MSTNREVDHLQIPFQELSDATNNFSYENLLAKGGFGKVFKGESVKYGKIAVKMLDPRQGQGDHEFGTEIALLSVYKHENIVSLLGFCDEGKEKMLVYKYESNGSLDTHLKRVDLTWIQRLHICLDAARGLQYLHDDVEPHHRILHRDIKSSNILLDENLKAKIADFGLSKIGPASMESTFLISNVCGTLGYIDPDYYHTGYLTQKSDVYSFGVVLFEVMCGRLSRVIDYNDERQFLTTLVKVQWGRKRFEEIIFSDLQKQINTASFITFSSIAYQCLMSVNERPTMKKVVEQLQKALDKQLASISGRWSDYLDFATHHQGQSERSMVSSSQSIPSSSGPLWLADASISSRREWTDKTFADQLNDALERQQVITYESHGTNPKESRTKILENSRIVIIVFTKNYVDSSDCLREVTIIMKNYTANTRGQIVIPIFHGVDPSEVKSQTGYYGEALAMHELKNMRKRVQSWRKALATAAGLSGWDVTNGNTTEHIQKIVARISSELIGLMQHSKPSADTGLIGINARTQEMKSLLEVGTGGVLKVGISGMWGSGKSTLVSSVYDAISYKFEGCSFVKNVRDRSRMHGLKMLQEEILSDVLKVDVTLTSLEQGRDMMERRLRQNSVLIVLDEVDHTDHLEMLVGSDDEWFGDGSRIIFTTRNQDLVNARSSLAHNVRMLDDEEAIELFSRRAFGKSAPAQGFEDASQKMVSKFGGNPSALIRLGSFLHGKHMNEWTSILNRLEGRPDNEILEEFKTPDDGLARKFFPQFLTEGAGEV